MLEGEPLSTFNVVRLASLGYGEIDPNFIVNNYLSLKQTWFICNSTSGFVEVEYNNSYDNPTLINGWIELLETYNLPENVEIEMAYYGGQNFSIKSFKEVGSSQSISSFHSRSLMSNETFYFDIVLNATIMKKEKLTLPAAFGAFLRNNDYKFLTICGDYHRQALLKVIKDKNSEKTKLGNTWDQLCKDFSFVAGDTIRFKFATNDPHQRCHLFYIIQFANASTS